MEQTKTNQTAKIAFLIGIVTIGIYVVNYYLRNMLSVTTPELLLDGSFTADSIAALSSIYMIFYAGGQLVNGFLGAIASAICFFTWNRSVELLSATKASLYLFVMPLITLVAEMIYAGTLPGIYSLLGMAITLIGLGTSELPLKTKKRNPLKKATENKHGK